MAEKKKLNPVDLVGIGNLLEYLVATDNITCEERDRIMLRIAKENNLAGYMLYDFAGYSRSKDDVLKRTTHRKMSVQQSKEQDESYISLTEIAQAHSEDALGYVIQSWLRSGNTLAFLNLWEKEHNSDYSEAGYIELLEKKKQGKLGVEEEEFLILYKVLSSYGMVEKLPDNLLASAFEKKLDNLLTIGEAIIEKNKNHQENTD